MGLIKNQTEFKIMREGGLILSEIMKRLENEVKPGIKTKELDSLAERLILKYKAKPAFKGFNNFPATLCVSVNHVIVHGVPNNNILQSGDIVSLDLGILWKGYYLDMAVTVRVGKIDLKLEKLIEVAKEAMNRGIDKMRKENYLGDVGFAIQNYVEQNHLTVVKELCGHGIGKRIHEEPQVLNYGSRGQGIKIRTGMMLCPEPMVVIGEGKIKQSSDGFGWETEDNSFAAHFEHTVAILDQGPLILTA